MAGAAQPPSAQVCGASTLPTSSAARSEALSRRPRPLIRVALGPRRSNAVGPVGPMPRSAARMPSYARPLRANETGQMPFPQQLAPARCRSPAGAVPDPVRSDAASRRSDAVTLPRSNAVSAAQMPYPFAGQMPYPPLKCRTHPPARCRTRRPSAALPAGQVPHSPPAKCRTPCTQPAGQMP
jgi:hypothetical protein